MDIKNKNTENWGSSVNGVNNERKKGSVYLEYEKKQRNKVHNHE